MAGAVIARLAWVLKPTKRPSQLLAEIVKPMDIYERSDIDVRGKEACSL
ncbi:MAG: hypothetical protein U0694_11385 [Anaerolineae bacterium]